MYVRKIEDQVLTLQVSGKLWMRSLVMQDVETGSEWAHLLGRAMAGPLENSKLKPLVTDMVTWGSWKKSHPDTTVLFMSRTARDYSSEFYKKPEFFVFGFEVNGAVHSVSMETLQKTPVMNFEAGERPLLLTFDPEGTVTHLFDRTVDRRTLTFEQQPDGSLQDLETGSTWTLLSGESTAGPLKGTALRPRVGIMSFSGAWKNFHTNSVPIDEP